MRALLAEEGLSLSVSVGAAELRAGQDLKALIREADEAMYHDKREAQASRSGRRRRSRARVRGRRAFLSCAANPPSTRIRLMPHTHDHSLEEALEGIWSARERRQTSIAAIREATKIPLSEELLGELTDGGLALVHDGGIELTRRARRPRAR